MKFEESVKFTKFDATSVAFAIIPSKRYDFPRIFNVTSKTSSQFPAGKLFHNERIQGTEEFFLLSELKKGEKLKLKEKLEKFLKVYKNRRSICSTLRLIFLSSFSSPSLLSKRFKKKKTKLEASLFQLLRAQKPDYTRLLLFLAAPRAIRLVLPRSLHSPTFLPQLAAVQTLSGRRILNAIYRRSSQRQ